MPLQHWSDRQEEPLSLTDRLLQWFLIAVSVGGLVGQILAVVISPRSMFVLLCAYAIGTVVCSASGLSCTVTAVSDGDTLTTICAGSTRKIRLSSVDAPESLQAYGQEARAHTAGLTLHQQVTIRTEDYDRYGRMVAHITLPDGRDLGRELVRAGLAWHYVRYSKDSELVAIEAAAREARAGLWRDPAPEPPSMFRREQRERGTRSRRGERRSERRCHVCQ